MDDIAERLQYHPKWMIIFKQIHYDLSPCPRKDAVNCAKLCVVFHGPGGGVGVPKAVPSGAQEPSGE